MLKLTPVSSSKLLCVALLAWTVCACSDVPDNETRADVSTDTVDTDYTISDGGVDDAGLADTLPQDAGALCPGGPGCACDDNEDCDAGLCLEGAEGRRCAKPCVDTCDEGFKCAQVASGSDIFSVCVDAWARLCSPCTSSDQCNYPGVTDARCVSRGADGDFCGAGCAKDEDCPSSYACKNSKDVDGKDTKQCFPVAVDGSLAGCKCSPNAVSLSFKTPCSRSVVLDGAEVICTGEALCKAAGKLVEHEA